MLDKKAHDVQVLHVAPLTSVAEYLVLGSAESDRQTRAVADHIHDLLGRGGHKPLSIEGASSGQWVLLDFGDVVAHIFRQDVRAHFALERLWSDALQVKIPADAPVPTVPPPKRIVVRRSKARKSG